MKVISTGRVLSGAAPDEGTHPSPVCDISHQIYTLDNRQLIITLNVKGLEFYNFFLMDRKAR